MKANTKARALPWAVPAVCLASLLLASRWWLPGVAMPLSAVVSGAVLAAGALAAFDLRVGLGAALLLLGAATATTSPEVHLWGDGALRLRSLSEGLPVSSAGRFEPLDTMAHKALVDLGMDPEFTFKVTGLVGATLYLAGLGLLLYGRSRLDRAALLVLALSPAWTVFFTGYVESYALLLGLAAVFAGLLARRTSPLLPALCALVAASVHLLGLLLLPAALAAALRRRSRAAVAICAAASVGAAAWLLLTGGSSNVPGLGQLMSPGPLSRLRLLVFAVPSALLFLPAVSSVKPAPSLLNISVWLAAFSVFPLERGAAIDWDLGAVMLAPVLLGLLPAAKRSGWLPAAALGAALLAGPRISAFLDADSSEERYVQTAEESGDAEALEELAIHMRRRDRLERSEELFRAAFEESGNGRHLAQLSEVQRMRGKRGEAFRAAVGAAELRPDLETVWLQLVLVARDFGRGRTAFEAARRHAEAFPDAEKLWPLALEALVPGGDPDLAWAAAESSLAGGRRNAPLLTNAATAAWMTGRTGLADSLYRGAVSLNPGNPLPLHNMGMIRLEEGDTAAARRCLQDALELDPGFRPARRALESLSGPTE